MSKIDFRTNARAYIEPGEEELFQVFHPRTEKGRTEKILLGIDNGSTQVRTTVVRRTDEMTAFDNVYVIPSTYTQVDAEDTLTPGGVELFHKMDSVICSNIEPQKRKFDKLRVVRGTKSVNSNGVISRINSSNQKVDTPAFYVNLVDAMAYSIIMDNEKRGMATAESYDAYLCCALPPDDADSDVNKEVFLGAILGSFEWTSLDLGVSFKINVKDVEITTEPEAAVKAHYLMNAEEIPEHVLCLESGGRSSASAILRNGILYDPANKTFDYGGTQLIEKVSDEYVNKYGGSRPREESIKRALTTGNYTRARLNIDVTDIIRDVKKKQGLQLLSDLTTQVFDTQKLVKAEDIEAILFSGRAFGRGDYNYSSADIIKETFDNMKTGCEFIEVEEYLIPIGNAIAAFAKFGGILSSNEFEVARLPEGFDGE